MTAEVSVSVAARLGECEEIIARGLGTFVEVGTALATIRDERLYLALYATFEDYCREAWGFSDSRARQMIGAALAAETVAAVTNVTVENEGQARAIAQVIRSDGPERAAEVLAEVAETGKVTAAAIREAARPTKTVTVVEEVTVDAETGEIIDPRRERLDAASADLDAAMVDLERLPFIAEDTNYRMAVLRRDLVRHIPRMSPPIDLPPADAAVALAGHEDVIDALRIARREIDSWHDQLEAALTASTRLRIVGND